MISHKTKIMMIVAMGFAVQGVYADDISYVPVYEKEERPFSIPPAGILVEPTYAKIPMRYPQLQEIQKRTSEIRREFLAARIKQYGFGAIGAMGAVLACYRVYQWLATDAAFAAKITVPLIWDVAGPDHEVRIKRIEERISPVLTKLEWVKQKGITVGEALGTIAAAHVIWNRLVNYLSQDLFHPDHGSMRWFTENKTSFITVMEELKQYVLVLDGPATKSEQNKAMYDYFIISAINSAVIHLESIIGFIDYKQSLVPDDGATQMAYISRYLFNVTDQFCHDVDALLARKDIEPCQRKAKMESMLNELRTEVARIVVSFARIEAEKGI